MRVPLEVEKEIEREKIAAYVVGHLPIVKAYAIKIGLVDIINELGSQQNGCGSRNNLSGNGDGYAVGAYARFID